MEKSTTFEKVVSVSALFCALIALIICIVPKPKAPIGMSATIESQQRFSTSTAILVTTASTLVQATTSRQYMAITNGGPQGVWLSLTGNAAVINQGILLNASSTYEVGFQKGNPVYGAIFGISAGTASSNLTVTGF